MKKNDKPRGGGKKLKLYRDRERKQLEDEGAKYVVFHLADERYAVNIASVQEILKPQNITEIPSTPDFLLGVVNLRGKIVPVVDLRRRFGLPVCDITKSTKIVVVHYQDQAIGMLVDSVLAVRPIPDKIIEQASPLISGSIDSDYFEGIANMGEYIAALLDINKALRKPAGSLASHSSRNRITS